MSNQLISRRDAVKGLAATLAAPFVFRHHATAAPSETVRHASIGTGGMAASDIGSLTRSKNLKLVAIADVDADRAAAMKQRFPDVNVYTDWRELLDKEKNLDSINVSTPDHMHACPTMRAIKMGLNVYTQKPLTQTIHEARKLTEAAKAANIVSQMGIQIHSHPVHKTVVQLIHDGAIGKVQEVHSWSNKKWGDTDPRPNRSDPIPKQLDWDKWLGVAAVRPFIGDGYYHRANWRKRLDFGTSTFGDMGCHILDPVFGALQLGYAKSVEADCKGPNEHNWGINAKVVFTFPGTYQTAGDVNVTWYDGDLRPPDSVTKLLEGRTASGQGSIYIGSKGILYSPYIAAPILIGVDNAAIPKTEGDDHYMQFVEAVRGQGQTSAPFSYAGPLTEMVLLGCLSKRYPQQKLEWDAPAMKVTNLEEANRHVRRVYRQGWEEPGLSES